MNSLSVRFLLVCMLLVMLSPLMAPALPLAEDPSSRLTLQCGVPEEFATSPVQMAPPATRGSRSVPALPRQAPAPVHAIPEPSTLCLLGLGLLLVLGGARRTPNA